MVDSLISGERNSWLSLFIQSPSALALVADVTATHGLFADRSRCLIRTSWSSNVIGYLNHRVHDPLRVGLSNTLQYCQCELSNQKFPFDRCVLPQIFEKRGQSKTNNLQTSTHSMHLKPDRKQLPI